VSKIRRVQASNPKDNLADSAKGKRLKSMDEKKGATKATAFVFISSPLFLLTLPLARPQIVSLCQNKKYSI